MKKSHICLIIALTMAAAALFYPVWAAGTGLPDLNWGIVATLIVVLIILAYFFDFESAALGSKEIALVAMLGTITAAARIPFAAIPSVQPCTFLIICSGYVFGPLAGFMVGAVTALVSNIFLGQGPWTPNQMLGWGLAGVSAAMMRRFNPSLVWLLPFGLLWGFLYGWIMNTWYWASFAYPLNLKTFLFYQSASLWFDAFHAAGNVIFLSLFGPKTIEILQRFKNRMSWKKIP
jgi:energy-coupling factor transport system substrate-specific component